MYLFVNGIKSKGVSFAIIERQASTPLARLPSVRRLKGTSAIIERQASTPLSRLPSVRRLKGTYGNVNRRNL